MDIYAYVYCTMNVASRVGCPHIQMYIGVHKSKGFDKNYLGSGLLIRRAIDKYGPKNFKCYMIKAFDNYDDALDYEHYLIVKYRAADYCNHMFYNLTDNRSRGPEGCSKESYTWFENPETDERTSAPIDKAPELMEQGFIQRYHPRVHMINSAGQEILVDYDEVEDYKNKGYKRYHISAEGRIWMNDGKNNVYVHSNNQESIQYYLDNGYDFGMVHSGPGDYVAVHKPDEKNKPIYLPPEEVDEALDNGYVLGTGVNPYEGKKRINNGIIECAVPEDQVESKLKEGWVLGRIKRKFMTNGEETVRVPIDQIEQYELNGYKITKNPNINGNSGLIHITNGTHDTRIPPEQLPEWEKKGYHRGRSVVYPNTSKGSKWYTNGIDNKVIKPNDDPQPLIDAGYTRGHMSRERIEENKKVYNKLREFLELPPLDEG